MRTLLHQLIADRAQQQPDAPAVVTGDATLSYGALDATSNQLARALRDAGCRRGDRICLLAGKSPAAISAIVAIYKADGIYVPLDLASPRARLARMLDAAEPAALLLTSDTVAQALELGRDGHLPSRIGQLDGDTPAPELPVGFTMADASRLPDRPVRSDNVGDDPAHLLFTSGSTGRPKGVIVTHASMRAFIAWASRYFGIGPGCRHSAHSPLAFDLSMHDVVGSLVAGAAVHPVPPHLAVIPHRLAEFMRDRALTHWLSVPAVLSLLVQRDVLRSSDGFPSLRQVMWCGEALPTRDLRVWMTSVPHAAFTNLYGPTETTIASSVYTVPAIPADDRQPVPIGRGCDGEELLVLGPDLQRIPAGTIGEIFIRGAGLSPGYWHDPDATAAAFLPNPHATDPFDRLYRTGDLGRVGPDGLVYFLGRRDSQIKRRGHRIELGEIETALRSLSVLADAVVVVVPASGGERLGCAFVPASGENPSPARLRTLLAQALPAYMLPDHWVRLEALPRNGNGKVDRSAVRARCGGDARVPSLSSGAPAATWRREPSVQAAADHTRATEDR